MIKGKQPEEIRKLFNIVNDFTPEEEEQIKKENEVSTPAPSVCPQTTADQRLNARCVPVHSGPRTA